jgi:MSHA biogenesis protein MshJ
MKRWWEVQSVRINALSLRERVFLFLSIMACSMALVDVIWLSPAKVAHKLLMQRFEKQSADLQRTRDALKLVAQPVDSGKAVRDELTAVKASLATLNQSIKATLPAQAEATPLAQVLVHLLRRHEGLTLLHTAVLAPEAASVKTAQASGGGTAALPASFTRQGVELKVAGPYPELMRYVQTLEKAMPEIRWGAMTLKSDTGPSELTLQLYLLGVSS